MICEADSAKRFDTKTTDFIPRALHIVSKQESCFRQLGNCNHTRNVEQIAEVHRTKFVETLTRHSGLKKPLGSCSID
jgi:hypothetical protein